MTKSLIGYLAVSALILLGDLIFDALTIANNFVAPHWEWFSVVGIFWLLMSVLAVIFASVVRRMDVVIFGATVCLYGIASLLVEIVWAIGHRAEVSAGKLPPADIVIDVAVNVILIIASVRMLAKKKAFQSEPPDQERLVTYKPE